MHHLAIYNFNNFRLRSEDPTNQGFHDRNDLNFAAAERSEGFVARSGYESDPGPASWGLQVYPRFYIETGDGFAPSSLSLWRDLPTLFAFTYAGIHLEAMRHARDWFDPHKWAPYVLWWVQAGYVPTWAEGVERLEHLHDQSASAFAFDFRRPLDALGQPTTIDRSRVRQHQTRNAVLQAELETQL
jgi:hypothetical protein